MRGNQARLLQLGSLMNADLGKNNLVEGVAIVDWLVCVSAAPRFASTSLVVRAGPTSKFWLCFLRHTHTHSSPPPPGDEPTMSGSVHTARGGPRRNPHGAARRPGAERERWCYECDLSERTSPLSIFGWGSYSKPYGRLIGYTRSPPLGLFVALPRRGWWSV